MCGILGIFARNKQENVIPEAIRNFEKIKHRGKDGYGATNGEWELFEKDWLVFINKLQEKKSSRILMHALHAIVGEEKQPFEKQFVSNCEIYNWRMLNEMYHGGFRNDAYTLFRLVQQQGLACLEEIDGDYAFCFWNNEKAILARDLFGVKPLWYSFDASLCMFASENKAVDHKGTLLNPRETLFFDMNKWLLQKKKRPFFKLKKEEEDDEVRAREKVERLLEHAFDKRTKDGKFAVLFSGGVDSTTLAFLAKKYQKQCVLYAAGTVGSQDLLWADKVAFSFEMSLKKIIIEEQQVIPAIKEIKEHIESDNYMKVSVALPFYFACREAKKDGFKIVLSGLGSEELFAGYERHALSKEINKECLQGLKNMHERDLYRDDVITMLHGLELRVPFLDKDLAAYAMHIAAELKIKSGIKKYILRKAAMHLGIPEEYAMRKKSAAQYGSGFDKLLERMAKKAKMQKAAFITSI